MLLLNLRERNLVHWRRKTGCRMPPVSGVGTGPIEESSGGLKRSDCLCPVCLDIFLEPVTLPCMHTFCKPCFLETVDKANMCCPLCRKRVSTWARLNSRNKTLVNVELWRRIQDAFPTQCERRVQGIEDDDDAGTDRSLIKCFLLIRIALIIITYTIFFCPVTIPRPRVCQPGELRKEYEDQISKVRGSGWCFRFLADWMAGVGLRLHNPMFMRAVLLSCKQHNSFCLCVQSCSIWSIMLHTNCAAVDLLKDLKEVKDCKSFLSLWLILIL